MSGVVVFILGRKDINLLAVIEILWYNITKEEFACRVAYIGNFNEFLLMDALCYAGKLPETLWYPL